jgi:hypothetical protein
LPDYLASLQDEYEKARVTGPGTDEPDFVRFVSAPWPEESVDELRHSRESNEIQAKIKAVAIGAAIGQRARWSVERPALIKVPGIGPEPRSVHQTNLFQALAHKDEEEVAHESERARLGPVVIASALAGGVLAVGWLLVVVAVLGSTLRPNPYTAATLALGGIVLFATLVVALTERRRD